MGWRRIGRKRRGRSTRVRRSVLAGLSAVAVLGIGLGPTAPVGAQPGGGYWMLGSDGTVHAFGAAEVCGVLVLAPGERAVDLEPYPDGTGYWHMDDDEVIAVSCPGSEAEVQGGVVYEPSLRPGERAISLSVLPDGSGYWIVTDRGRALPQGTATFHGDLAEVRLNGPVVGSAATPTGLGYWMVAGDGGVFAFGDARFSGSMGDRPINEPVTTMAPDPDGTGYWLTAADGGVFAFAADFHGSMGSVRLNRPVTGMVPSPSGAGYLVVAEDGGVFAFGDTAFHGSLADDPPPDPIVAIAALDGSATGPSSGG